MFGFFPVTDLIAFFSFRFFIRLVAGNPIPFALNYTVGHLLQLSASTFLCGPKRQFMYVWDDATFALISWLSFVDPDAIWLKSSFWTFALSFSNMFDEKRRETSIIYLSCLALTLIIIFIPLPSTFKLITLLLLTLTQFCASVWYSLSYIPYGRRTAIRMLKKAVGIEESSPYAGIGIQIGGSFS